MAKKQIPTTVKNYRKWTFGHYVAQGGEYVVAALPETIMTIVKWEEWSAQCGNKYSLGVGFTTAMIGVIASVIAVAQKQKVFKNKLTSYVAIALIITIFAIACMFLARLLTEFGYMLMCCAGGLLGAASLEITDQKVIEPNAAEYKKLYDENGFNKRAVKKNERTAQRLETAKKEARIKM